MLVKDQIRIQMNRLGVSARELAGRVGTSEQTVRGWISGRSFPAKKRIPILEKALSFRLDFSEGATVQGPTVEAAMEAADIELFLRLRKLPAPTRRALDKLVEAIGSEAPVPAFMDSVKGGTRAIPSFAQRTKGSNLNVVSNPSDARRKKTN